MKIVPVLYPALFRNTLARLEFLTTSSFQVWRSTRIVYPRQAQHPFSSPKNGGMGFRVQGLEFASKTNPSKTSFFARLRVSLSRPARMFSEGCMNPVILLVDIPSANRDQFKHFLQDQHYEVVVSHYAESAVGYSRQLQPDLVLLYDSLPETNCFSLCRQLKRDPLNQLTPVVLIKPAPDQLDFHRGHAAGASDVWAAPSSLWDAIQRIQTLMRLKTYMDEQARSSLFSLARSVDSKQNLRNGHSDLLLNYAELLGRSLGLGDEDILQLRIACWLHDVGKVVVPESILLKPGPLDATETQIMQEHPVIGEQICAPLKSLRPILPLIRHHHEKMDGSGYPDGLRGDAIPLNARILQVADIYDALTTDRPYRVALPHNEALSILFAEAENGWLDSAVVSKFALVSKGHDYFPVRGHTMLASYYA